MTRTGTCSSVVVCTVIIHLILILENGNIRTEATFPEECGGTLDLTPASPTAAINTTDPSSSDDYLYCSWHVRSPDDTYIVFSFQEVNLDYSADIDIFDSSGRPLISVQEWRYRLNPVFSDSSALVNLIRRYRYPGLNLFILIHYTDMLVPNDNGVLLSSGGVIDLKNVSSVAIESANLDNETDVKTFFNLYWYVISPQTSRIQVAYNDVQSAGQCLTVYDSGNTSLPVSAFRGVSKLPAERVFTENAVTFVLSCDGNVPGQGVKYTVSKTDEIPLVGSRTCGGKVPLDVTRPNFTINSPAYFDAEPSTGWTKCWWYVFAPPGTAEVQLTWQDGNADNEIYLYDDPLATTHEVTMFQGQIDSNLSASVSSRGGLTVVMDGSLPKNWKDFRAEVSLSAPISYVGPRSCGGTIKLSDAMPNFTLNYPYYYEQSSSDGRLGCCWYVSGQVAGSEVQLDILDIDTGEGEYVQVYDDPWAKRFDHRVLQTNGNDGVEISPLVSTRGGFTFCYADYVSGSFGRGFLADFSLTYELTTLHLQTESATTHSNAKPTLGLHHTSKEVHFYMVLALFALDMVATFALTSY